MKRNTIITILLMSALLIAGAFAFAGCGAGDAENGGEEPTAASSEEPAPPDAAAEDAWKSAYRGILEEHADGIRNYENPEELGSTFDGRKAAALCDLDEDGTPELLFFTAKDYREVLHIYSYKNGRAEEITYPWTQIVTSDEGEAEDDKMSPAQAAGGSEYVVYKEKGVKGFTTYSTITDTTLEAATNRYKIGDSGDVDRISLLGMFIPYDDFDGNGHVGLEYAEYYDTYEMISREEYEETMNASVDDMGTVLFRLELIGEEIDADTYVHDNNPELWKKSKGKEISITYDEMMQKLSDGSKEGSADMQDGKNMEALLKAYGELKEKDVLEGGREIDNEDVDAYLDLGCRMASAT